MSPTSMSCDATQAARGFFIRRLPALVGAGVLGAAILISGCSRPETESPAKSAADAKYEVGVPIRFGKSGNSESFRKSGWSHTEPDYTWTDGPSASLAFTGLPQSEPLTLKMTMAGLTKPPQLPFQTAEVYANGKKIAEWQVAEKKEYAAPIPADAVNASGVLNIEFRIPQASSPESLGQSADARRLGLCVSELTVALSQ